MNYFDGSTHYLVSLALVLITGVASALTTLWLSCSGAVPQRPARLVAVLGLAFAPALLALALGFHPLIEALQYSGRAAAIVQFPVLEAARLLLAGGGGLLLTLMLFALAIAPALAAGTTGVEGRKTGPIVAAALVLVLVAVGVFEYSRSGLNLIRYTATVYTTSTADPALLEEARSRHAVLRAESVSIPDLATEVTRAAFVGTYGGAVALLLACGLGVAGFFFARGVQASRGFTVGALVLVLGLAALDVFWLTRLHADAVAAEQALFAPGEAPTS